LEASRQYQNNIEVVSTLRNLMMRTINMGKWLKPGENNVNYRP
jgi:hypothetical protein